MKKQTKNHIEIDSSEILVENKWTKIVNEKFHTQTGIKGDYLIVERQPAIMIIPVIEEGDRIYTYIVKQYRHPIGKEVWQFPMGTLESQNDPIEHARDELREETGLIANSLIFVKDYFIDPGLSRQKCFVYIAENIIEGGKQELEGTEIGMIAKRIEVSDLEKMVDKGDDIDGWMYASMFFLRQYLKQKQV